MACQQDDAVTHRSPMDIDNEISALNEQVTALNILEEEV